jgi:hypothetical protein
LEVDTPEGQNVVRCDQEDGGCDRLYAVFWLATLTATSHTIGTEKDGASEPATEFIPALEEEKGHDKES